MNVCWKKDANQLGFDMFSLQTSTKQTNQKAITIHHIVRCWFLRNHKTQRRTLQIKSKRKRWFLWLFPLSLPHSLYAWVWFIRKPLAISSNVLSTDHWWRTQRKFILAIKMLYNTIYDRVKLEIFVMEVSEQDLDDKWLWNGKEYQTTQSLLGHHRGKEFWWYPSQNVLISNLNLGS